METIEEVRAAHDARLVELEDAARTFITERGGCVTLHALRVHMQTLSRSDVDISRALTGAMSFGRLRATRSATGTPLMVV